MTQTATWKKTWIEFKKYKEHNFWANIKEIYWNFRFVRIVFFRKKIFSRTSSLAITDSSDVHCFDLYPINIFTKDTKTEWHTDVMKADASLFICYCSISKFVTKVQIERRNYFRYTLVCSPWCSFRCTGGTWHKVIN